MGGGELPWEWMEKERMKQGVKNAVAVDGRSEGNEQFLPSPG